MRESWNEKIEKAGNREKGIKVDVNGKEGEVTKRGDGGQRKGRRKKGG